LVVIGMTVPGGSWQADFANEQHVDHRGGPATLAVCLAAGLLMAACSSDAGHDARPPPCRSRALRSTCPPPRSRPRRSQPRRSPPRRPHSQPPDDHRGDDHHGRADHDHVLPTTTTIPPGASLTLRGDGIGDATFGNDADDVTSYISGILGGPTADSGWFNAASQTCPGTEARFVFWNDLLLVFGDESNISTGRRHFYYWSLGPPAGLEIDPARGHDVEGIGVGSTVADIRAAYPDATTHRATT